MRIFIRNGALQTTLGALISHADFRTGIKGTAVNEIIKKFNQKIFPVESKGSPKTDEPLKKLLFTSSVSEIE